MRLSTQTITFPPGLDPAIVAAADKAMSFDFDAQKLVDMAVESNLPAREAVDLITASDEMATLDDTTSDVARMAFERARTRSTSEVVDVMEAVDDALTMDSATVEGLDLGLRAMSTRSTSDVVDVIERVDDANVMDADTLAALHAELG